MHFLLSTSLLYLFHAKALVLVLQILHLESLKILIFLGSLKDKSIYKRFSFHFSPILEVFVILIL